MTVSEALQQITDKVTPGLDGIHVDLITAVSGVLVCLLILLGIDIMLEVVMQQKTEKTDKKLTGGEDHDS